LGAPESSIDQCFPSFASEAKLVGHFEKHGKEFHSKSADEYLNIGRGIIDNGQQIKYFYEAAGEMRTGYVEFIKNSKKTGEALFGFVGTNSDGFITTIHTKSRTDLFKLLGDNIQSRPKAFRSDTIGLYPKNGWMYPYGK